MSGVGKILSEVDRNSVSPRRHHPGLLMSETSSTCKIRGRVVPVSLDSPKPFSVTDKCFPLHRIVTENANATTVDDRTLAEHDGPPITDADSEKQRLMDAAKRGPIGIGCIGTIDTFVRFTREESDRFGDRVLIEEDQKSVVIAPNRSALQWTRLCFSGVISGKSSSRIDGSSSSYSDEFFTWRECLLPLVYRSLALESSTGDRSQSTLTNNIDVLRDSCLVVYSPRWTAKSDHSIGLSSSSLTCGKGNTLWRALSFVLDALDLSNSDYGLSVYQLSADSATDLISGQRLRLSLNRQLHATLPELRIVPLVSQAQAKEVFARAMAVHEQVPHRSHCGRSSRSLRHLVAAVQRKHVPLSSSMKTHWLGGSPEWSSELRIVEVSDCALNSNPCLLNLQSCVMTLLRNRFHAPRLKKAMLVPYRNSYLTRLLQQFIDGSFQMNFLLDLKHFPRLMDSCMAAEERRQQRRLSDVSLMNLNNSGMLSSESTSASGLSSVAGMAGCLSRLFDMLNFVSVSESVIMMREQQPSVSSVIDHPPTQLTGVETEELEVSLFEDQLNESDDKENQQQWSVLHSFDQSIGKENISVIITKENDDEKCAVDVSVEEEEEEEEEEEGEEQQVDREESDEHMDLSREDSNQTVDSNSLLQQIETPIEVIDSSVETVTHVFIDGSTQTEEVSEHTDDKEDDITIVEKKEEEQSLKQNKDETMQLELAYASELNEQMKTEMSHLKSNLQMKEDSLSSLKQLVLATHTAMKRAENSHQSELQKKTDSIQKLNSTVNTVRDYIGIFGRTVDDLKNELSDLRWKIREMEDSVNEWLCQSNRQLGVLKENQTGLKQWLDRFICILNQWNNFVGEDWTDEQKYSYAVRLISYHESERSEMKSICLALLEEKEENNNVQSDLKSIEQSAAEIIDDDKDNVDLSLSSDDQSLSIQVETDVSADDKEEHQPSHQYSGALAKAPLAMWIDFSNDELSRPLETIEEGNEEDSDHSPPTEVENENDDECLGIELSVSLMDVASISSNNSPITINKEGNEEPPSEELLFALETITHLRDELDSLKQDSLLCEFNAQTSEQLYNQACDENLKLREQLLNLQLKNDLLTKELEMESSQKHSIELSKEEKDSKKTAEEHISQLYTTLNNLNYESELNKVLHQRQMDEWTQKYQSKKDEIMVIKESNQLIVAELERTLDQRLNECAQMSAESNQMKIELNKCKSKSVWLKMMMQLVIECWRKDRREMKNLKQSASKMAEMCQLMANTAQELKTQRNDNQSIHLKMKHLESVNESLSIALQNKEQQLSDYQQSEMMKNSKLTVESTQMCHLNSDIDMYQIMFNDSICEKNRRLLMKFEESMNDEMSHYQCLMDAHLCELRSRISMIYDKLSIVNTMNKYDDNHDYSSSLHIGRSFSNIKSPKMMKMIKMSESKMIISLLEQNNDESSDIMKNMQMKCDEKLSLMNGKIQVLTMKMYQIRQSLNDFNNKSDDGSKKYQTQMMIKCQQIRKQIKHLKNNVLNKTIKETINMISNYTTSIMDHFKEQILTVLNNILLENHDLKTGVNMINEKLEILSVKMKNRLGILNDKLSLKMKENETLNELLNESNNHKNELNQELTHTHIRFDAIRTALMELKKQLSKKDVLLRRDKQKLSLLEFDKNALKLRQNLLESIVWKITDSYQGLLEWLYHKVFTGLIQQQQQISKKNASVKQHRKKQMNSEDLCVSTLDCSSSSSASVSVSAFNFEENLIDKLRHILQERLEQLSSQSEYLRVKSRGIANKKLVSNSDDDDDSSNALIKDDEIQANAKRLSAMSEAVSNRLKELSEMCNNADTLSEDSSMSINSSSSSSMLIVEQSREKERAVLSWKLEEIAHLQSRIELGHLKQFTDPLKKQQQSKTAAIDGGYTSETTQERGTHSEHTLLEFSELESQLCEMQEREKETNRSHIKELTEMRMSLENEIEIMKEQCVSLESEKEFYRLEVDKLLSDQMMKQQQSGMKDGSSMMSKEETRRQKKNVARERKIKFDLLAQTMSDLRMQKEELASSNSTLSTVNNSLRELIRKSERKLAEIAGQYPDLKRDIMQISNSVMELSEWFSLQSTLPVTSSLSSSLVLSGDTSKDAVSLTTVLSIVTRSLQSTTRKIRQIEPYFHSDGKKNAIPIIIKKERKSAAKKTGDSDVEKAQSLPVKEQLSILPPMNTDDTCSEAGPRR